MCSKCSEDKNVRIIVKLGSITEIIDYRLNKSKMHSEKERGDTNWFGERFKGLYTFSYFYYSFINIFSNFYIKWHFDDKLDQFFVSICKRFSDLCPASKKMCNKETARILCWTHYLLNFINFRKNYYMLFLCIPHSIMGEIWSPCT